MASFSKILESAEVSDGRARVTVSDDWLQGRSIFGGLQVAIALRAMRSLVPTVPLRTLQATFVAPIPAGSVEVRAEIVRTGKSATHVEARIGDAGETKAVVFGVFGLARASAVTVRPKTTPLPTSDAPELPFIPNLMPTFLQHFAVRWLRGSPPYSGNTETEHTLDITLRDEERAGEAHLIAIADFIPPIALSHLTAPAPGSTVTWLLELLLDHIDEPPAHWRIDSQLIAARDGYTSQSLMVSTPSGVPAALGHQAMLVFG